MPGQDIPEGAFIDGVPEDEWENEGGAVTPEILGEEPAQLASQELIEQLLGGAGTPEPEPISVRRYWLDEASFRAIAVLEQGGEVGILLSDGENQIMLFDSVSQPIDALYLLAEIISTAEGVLREPNEGIDSE